MQFHDLISMKADALNLNPNKKFKSGDSFKIIRLIFKIFAVLVLQRTKKGLTRLNTQNVYRPCKNFIAQIFENKSFLVFSGGYLVTRGNSVNAI